MLFINDYMSEMHGCLTDPQGILAGNTDAVRFSTFIIGDQEGGVAVISGNEQDIWVMQQLLFGNEGHHVLGIPGEASRFHGSDFLFRFGAVDGLSAVEDGGGAVIMEKGNGLIGSVHTGQGFPDFLAGMIQHDGGGHCDGQHRVYQAAGQACLFNAEILLFVKKGC